MQSTTNQPECHELRVIGTNGHSFYVPSDMVTGIVTSRLYVLSIVAFCAMIALVNAPLFNMPIGLASRFAVWLGTCTFVTGLWLAVYFGILALAGRTGRQAVMPNVVINVLGITSAIWLQYLLSIYVFGMPPLPNSAVWIEALRYFAVATVFEIVTVSLVMPKMEGVRFAKSIEAQKTRSAPDPTPHVTLPNRTIRADELLFMKSVEHYVEFTTTTETFLERAPLRSLLEQVDTADGIQTHRSYWVNRLAMPELTRVNGNPALQLTDGTIIPVARSRRSEVEEWLEKGAA